ncbi:MAG: hypothetical protein IJ675_08440 [Pseudobutyrivibrio sp.]|nr:hypothetical protein [Pseudobutyrivibrio sp.]
MIEIASIFQNKMLLQRDKKICIWGRGDIGKELSIVIQGEMYETSVDEAGNWKTYIGPLAVAESTELIVSDGESKLTIEDVAVGDVYIASGQSNMEFLMRYEKHIAEEKKVCANASIRFFDVPEISYERQDKDFDYSNVGIWRKTTAEDLQFFSAPAYYMAKTLNAKLGIPIGIVGLNWGGTRTSVWMSEEHANEVCPDLVADFERKLNGKSYAELIEAAGKSPLNDRGYSSWEPFSEFMMPRTPSPEEIGAFMAQAAQTAEFDDFANSVLPVEKPGCLYERMVKPVAPFGAKGVLWYQGESDAEVLEGAKKYETALTTMMNDWRELWNEKLPFFIVQLPGFRSWLETSGENYTYIRDAQKQICDKDDNAYLCSISDSGEEFDIHPKNKKVVGERLAALALKYLYKQDIVVDAPSLNHIERNGNTIAIYFDNAGEGLKLNGESINALEIFDKEATIDYSFEILKDRVVINLKANPTNQVTIQFAYTDWYLVNLYNSAGMPAIPFCACC